jgi:N-methylhydantoinase B
MRKAPFTYEVIRDSLVFLCEEMGAELRKIAISTIIREAQDFATGLTDARGQLIAQAAYTPGHYNTISAATRGVLASLRGARLRPGDVLITNDPWLCAGHLPDIFVFTPAFIGGRLFAFLVTVAHHIDVGGKNPGSTTPNSTEIYQEGLQIPPLKLREGGRPNTTLEAMVRQNVRLPEVVLSDIRSQLAVNDRGRRRLEALCRKFGPTTVQQAMQDSLARSERLTRAEIARIPDGCYRWADALDDDGVTEEPVKIAATVAVRGERIAIDFAGSSPQVRGGINMTPPFRDAYTHMAVRCFLDPAIPHNEGCLRPVRIIAPEGTVVNPRRPAAVAGRGEVIGRLVDVLIACLSQAVPARTMAGYGGNRAQPVFSGIQPRTGRPFIMMDTTWGGMGGRRGKDGATCLSFPQNVGNHSIEVLESLYPVQVARFAIRQDSEGAGRFRGGFGAVKDYRFLVDGTVQCGGDRCKFPPFGLEGGRPGPLEEFVLIRQGTEERLRTKRDYALRAGDVFSVRTPGGGGLGDPLARDPARVLADWAADYISLGRAREVYGVAIDPAGAVVDAEARRARREGLASGPAAGARGRP